MVPRSDLTAHYGEPVQALLIDEDIGVPADGGWEGNSVDMSIKQGNKEQ